MSGDAPPPFPATRKGGDLWYKLQLPTGPVGNIRPDGVRTIIADACSRWSAVSPFDFRDMDNAPGLQPPSTPDVVVSFGPLPPGTNPAGVAGVPVNVTNPRKLIFRPDVPWTTPSDFLRDPEVDKEVSVWGRTSFINWALKTVGEFTSVSTDLRTVAVHELGHVLGLGHNEDSNSVMQSYVEQPSFRFFLGEKGIPTVDVVTLDALYATEGGFPPITKADSYAIVGGRMYAANMQSQGFKDDSDCEWGEEAPDRVLLGTGYGWNKALNQKGYCHVIGHLMPSDQPDTTGVEGVVGGFANTGGTAPEMYSWGRASSTIHMFAKLYSYAAPYKADRWLYWFWYLEEWTANQTPVLFTGGQQKKYEATSKTLKQTVYGWGQTSAYGVNLAQGRTYIDSNASNSNANGFIVGFRSTAS